MDESKKKRIAYSVFCKKCDKEIPMEVDPQTEAEWKEIQRHINKKEGLCIDCQRDLDNTFIDYDYC